MNWYWNFIGVKNKGGKIIVLLIIIGWIYFIGNLSYDSYQRNYRPFNVGFWGDFFDVLLYFLIGPIIVFSLIIKTNNFFKKNILEEHEKKGKDKFHNVDGIRIRKFNKEGELINKKCSECMKWRKLDFYKYKNSIDGLGSKCRVCERRYTEEREGMRGMSDQL